jgi:hypothetical protein
MADPSLGAKPTALPSSSTVGYLTPVPLGTCNCYEDGFAPIQVSVSITKKLLIKGPLRPANDIRQTRLDQRLRRLTSKQTLLYQKKAQERETR